MRALIAFFVLGVFGLTAIAVGVKSAQYKSETNIAQSQSETQIAIAESQEAIAGYQAGVAVADISAQLELARMEAETTRLGYQVELARVQATLAQISMDLENAQADRQRLWMMLVLPGLAVIAVVIVALVVLVAVLKRPAAYPRITTVSREIVPVHPAVVGVVLATRVTKKQDADYYTVSR